MSSQEYDCNPDTVQSKNLASKLGAEQPRTNAASECGNDATNPAPITAPLGPQIHTHTHTHTKRETQTMTHNDTEAK